ncbi:MAG: hypothetical protein LBO68_06535, partial [Synergistaceae bacterium]|nr:hypothetical protein [Synergistaceae bacterium]
MENAVLTMELNAELGTLARMRGEYDSALDFFQIFRSLASEAGQVQRLAQAYIQLGNLCGEVGMWSEADAYYQEAFSAALKAGDMDNILIAMQGIYAGDVRREAGLVGKVDYKSMQGIPWRSALTARSLRKGRKGSHKDQGFLTAWATVDSLRGEILTPIPSVDGFRLIREMAFRGAPEVRHYYQEVKVAWDIGDAVLRRVTERLRTARNAEEALRELAARKGEAAEEEYVESAFGTTLNLLRTLAGEEMLKEVLPGSKGDPFIQVGGILVEATEPEEGPASGLDADFQTLSRMISRLSLKASETAELQKNLSAGRSIPAPLKDKLRKTLFSSLQKTPPSSDELQRILVRLLETTHPSLKKEAGRLSLKGGKLYGYAQRKLKEQQSQLNKEAADLF